MRRITLAGGLLAVGFLGIAPVLGVASAGAAVPPDQVWLSSVSGGIDSGNTSNTLTFSDGSSATQTLTNQAGTHCLPGAGQGSPVGPTNPYYTPPVPTGTPFEAMSCAFSSAFTTSVTFSQQVSNPELHIVNLDGSSLTIGGTSTTGAPIVVQKVSGNNALTVSGNIVNPSPIGVGYSGCESDSGSHQYGQCGSLVLTVSSGAIRTFTLNDVSVTGQDGWALSYSFPAPPKATDDTATTAAGTATTVDPASNDTAGGSATIDPTSVRLIDGGAPVTTLTNSDGTYTIDTSTGIVTFTPAAGFSGTATPVTYEISDSNGDVATATITVTVAAVVGTPMIDGSVAGSVAILVLLTTGGVFLVRRRRPNAQGS